MRLRLRPIVMTSLAFGLGVLPLALAHGAGSGAQNAIGWGVLGGMITGTLLCVLFVPLFYVMIMRVSGSANERNVDLQAAAAETAFEAKALKEGELTFYEREEENKDTAQSSSQDSGSEGENTSKADKKGE